MSPKLYHVIVYVPVSDAGRIRDVLDKAKAGAIGNYDACSFSTRGIGRFRPGANAHPHIGEANTLEEVEEERIEVVVSEEHLKVVITELKNAHPYEEPAIHILSMMDYKNI